MKFIIEGKGGKVLKVKVTYTVSRSFAVEAKSTEEARAMVERWLDDMEQGHARLHKGDSHAGIWTSINQTEIVK